MTDARVSEPPAIGHEIFTAPSIDDHLAVATQRADHPRLRELVRAARAEGRSPERS